jgi:hypothetical protein
LAENLNFYKKVATKKKSQGLQAKIDFLKWYLSGNSSEIYGKFRVLQYYSITGQKKLRKSILACTRVKVVRKFGK